MGAHDGVAGGQGGEALDQALGLLRVPALRAALRRRPLPGDIGELLAVASGSTDATRAAAVRTGSDPGQLVEAARFYIQQVLLADGADAYRQLGAASDADQALLRDHHRLLLRWLHPDRSEGAQWDSALATRVNQAWNQLRTPLARERYDAQLAAASAAAPPEAAEVSTPEPIAPPIAYATLPPPNPVPVGPVAVGLLAIACLALAWLAISRERTLDDLRDASRFQAPRVDVSERMAMPLPVQPQGVDLAAPAPLPAQAPPAEAAPDAQALAALAALADAVADASGDALDDVAGNRNVTDDASNDTPRDPNDAAAPPAEPPPAAAPAGEGEDPLTLFHEAEAAVRHLAAWFATGRGAEPRWLDPATAQSANAARGRLQSRHAAAPRTRMTVVDPGWTLGDHAAAMSGAYRLEGRRGTLETGLLRVEFQRRDREWRIARLHLDPAQ